MTLCLHIHSEHVTPVGHTAPHPRATDPRPQQRPHGQKVRHVQGRNVLKVISSLSL